MRFRRILFAVIHAALFVPAAAGCDGDGVQDESESESSSSEESSASGLASAMRLDAVSFKTVLGGKYLSAEGNGGAGLSASSSVSGAWERFHLIRHGEPNLLSSGDRISLCKGGRYCMQAVGGGGQIVNVKGQKPREWETFRIVREAGPGRIRANDIVGLQSVSGKWLSAQNGGGGAVWAWGKNMGAWERFVFQPND